MDFVSKSLVWLGARYTSETQWMWLRQIFHFLGGALFAQLFVWWGEDYLKVMGGGLLFTIIATKEALEYGTQMKLKSYLDSMSWVLGYVSVAIW